MTGIQTTSNRRRKRTSKSPKIANIISLVRNIGYSSTPYRLLISGHIPQRISAKPSDLRTGDTAVGNDILSGSFNFLGYKLNGAAWNNFKFGEDWQIILHGFSWLRDLRVITHDSAKKKMRELVSDWIHTHKSIDSFAWRPDILGQRLNSWLLASDFMLMDCDQKFSEKLFFSVALQSKHLSRTLRQCPDGAPRFKAIKGLYSTGICIPNSKYLETAYKSLSFEIKRQILPDGSQIERSPSAHLSILSDLIDIRDSLGNAKLTIPENLQFSIDRMSSTLRSYRHGDGALALFNDSLEETAWLIDLVLAKSNAHGRAHPAKLYSGFQRLQSGRTLIILDSGPPASIGNKTHAGTFSFEMSIGKERIIVNCGAWRGGDESWRTALRATAAHSTLTVDDTNSSELLSSGGIGTGAEKINSEFKQKEGALYLSMSHDGFNEPFNLIHERQLYLSADGSDLRGTDTLVQSKNNQAKGRSFAIRFHIHPDVQTSLVHDGNTVLLRLPSGLGWQMRVNGANLDLAESIYCGQAGKQRRSSQIVMTGPIDPTETIVKWALSRIPKK
tara:strand:+ start:2021 stop:3694 length:1674 start_codon:yes stop_codon:yes gene_type:complete